jgi:para-nitrobenzyl esterase
MLLSAAALVGGISASSVALAADPEANGPTIKTTEGKVRGFSEGGVDIFLGIPYAAPPVGNLRWKAPEPPASHGLLKAVKFGNTCPQVTELGAFAGPASTTEDCLYLNVFSTDAGKKATPKPVIVWIHGGGFVDGESNDYDATKLAKGANKGQETVVVTINYRLGLLGYLSHPALNKGKAWGNYGILDIQAALRWVQANIAAFGGDPTRVALGGQSAGSSATSANLVSPLATGLFNRAINQSGPGGNFQSAATALQRGTAFAEAAGCSGSGNDAAKCLRKLSVARILQLQGTPNANGPYITGPFVDGKVIPISGDQAWATGAYNKMPIMGGRVKDESNFGLSISEYFSGPPQKAITPEEYEARNSPAVLAEYPLSDYDNDPTYAQDRVGTDPGMCRALATLKAQASTNNKGVYGYNFTYQNTPYYFPQMPNEYSPTGFFRPLAYHTADIQYVFKNWHGGNLGVNLDQVNGQPRELQGDEKKLSNQLIAAWTNFAATGNPNGKGAPVWPAFTTDSPTFLQQDTPSTTQTEDQYREMYKCDFWDQQNQS